MFGMPSAGGAGEAAPPNKRLRRQAFSWLDTGGYACVRRRRCSALDDFPQLIAVVACSAAAFVICCLLGCCFCWRRDSARRHAASSTTPTTATTRFGYSPRRIFARFMRTPRIPAINLTSGTHHRGRDRRADADGVRGFLVQASATRSPLSAAVGSLKRGSFAPFLLGPRDRKQRQPRDGPKRSSVLLGFASSKGDGEGLKRGNALLRLARRAGNSASKLLRIGRKVLRNRHRFSRL